MTNTSSAGWYRDPTGRFANRYWNGQQWTNQVSGGGVTGIDEPPSETLFVPPSPGSASPSAPVPPTVQVTQQAPRSSVGTVVAVVLGIIAIVAVLFLFMNQSSDSDSTNTTSPPATTEAPAESSSDG